MRKRPQLREYAEDARPFLRRSDVRYDAIFVDAYRQPYIPFYLATREFFELVRDRLAPGGAVVVNAGHPEGNDDLEKVLTATMGEVFPNVARDPLEPTNTLLVGAETPVTRDNLIARVARGCPPSCARSRCRPRTGSAGARAAARVYTDDKAPVEWLIDKSIVEYAAGGDPED